MTPLLTARNLTVGHAGKALVADIDLTLHPGRILCLLGPNGAGKTTLFRTLLGLIPPVAGQITLGDTPLASLSRVQIAARLAHVPQSLATPFAFTALDIVLMGASARLGPFSRPGPIEHERAMQALAALGIADLAATEITRLSGGQRQLVLIARALAQQARAIVMDEPTASLDFANRIQVSQAIRSLAANGTAVILSSHDPDQAASLGDEALLMGRGSIIASGPVHQVMSAENLTLLYGIPVSRAVQPDGRAHFF